MLTTLHTSLLRATKDQIFQDSPEKLNSNILQPIYSFLFPYVRVVPVTKCPTFWYIST